MLFGGKMLARSLRRIWTDETLVTAVQKIRWFLTAPRCSSIFPLVGLKWWDFWAVFSVRPFSFHNVKCWHYQSANFRGTFSGLGHVWRCGVVPLVKGHLIWCSRGGMEWGGAPGSLCSPLCRSTSPRACKGWWTVRAQSCLPDTQLSSACANVWFLADYVLLSQILIWFILLTILPFGWLSTKPQQTFRKLLVWLRFAPSPHCQADSSLSQIHLLRQMLV